MSNVASERKSVGRPRKDADVDYVVVERLLSGDRQVRYGWSELDAAILDLLARGLTGLEIAHRLGVSSNTIYRHNRRRADG